MRRLLDASSQRQIIILETLATYDGWTNLTDLALAAGASERTVADDIWKLRENWSKTLNIEVSKKTGVILRNRSAAGIGLVCQELFNKSVALRWIKELLVNPNHGLDFYLDRLFVSRSTLTRLLPRINGFLLAQGMALETNNNRYRLVSSDEQHLRDFSTGFILELFGLDPLTHDIDIDFEVIKKIVFSILAKNLEPQEFAHVVKDQVSVVYWMVFYVVSLIRENQGFNICSGYPMEAELDKEDLDYIQNHFPSLTRDNLRSIHHMIIRNFNGWDSEAETALVLSETTSFLQRTFSIFGIVPDAQTKAALRFTIRSLYLSAKYRPFPTSTLFNRIYHFSLALKQANPHLYRIVEENLRPFSQNTKIDLSSRIDDVLFWLCLNCPGICQCTCPKTALLISDFGISHARFLADVLTGFFNHEETKGFRLEVAVYPQGLSSVDLDKYDILITTTPNLPVSHKNIILVNDYPGFESIAQIYQALTR